MIDIQERLPIYLIVKNLNGDVLSIFLISINIIQSYDTYTSLGGNTPLDTYTKI